MSFYLCKAPTLTPRRGWTEERSVCALLILIRGTREPLHLETFILG